MKEILTATQTTGEPFNAPGQIGVIMLIDHHGGTWQLQIQTPAGTWIDDEPTWTESGVKAWHCTYELPYRLTGGDVGARAFLLGNEYRPASP